MRPTPVVTRLSTVVALTLLAALTLGFKSSSNAVSAKWTAIVIHTGPGEADIHFTADIPGGWRMYSQNMTGVDGPLPTSIEFDPNPSFNVVGPPKEMGKKVSFFQDDLGVQVSCLEGQAQYIQHISFKEENSFVVKCVVNYMLERDGEILPPDDEDFTITIQP